MNLFLLQWAGVGVYCLQLLPTLIADSDWYTGRIFLEPTDGQPSNSVSTRVLCGAELACGEKRDCHAWRVSEIPTRRSWTHTSPSLWVPFPRQKCAGSTGKWRKGTELSLPVICLTPSLTWVSATEQEESPLSYSPGPQLPCSGPLLEDDFCPCCL